jgi:hypothetical protein
VQANEIIVLCFKLYLGFLVASNAGQSSTSNPEQGRTEHAKVWISADLILDFIIPDPAVTSSVPCSPPVLLLCLFSPGFIGNLS